MGTQKEPAAAEESYFIAHCTLWLSNFQGAGPPSDTIPHSIKITIIAVASSEVGQSTRVQWRSEVAGQCRGEETVNFSEIVITPILGDDSCWLLVQFGLMKGGLLLFFSIILMHNLQCDLNLTSPPANDTPNTRRVTCVCRLKLLPSRRAITTTIFLFLFFAFCYCCC